MSEAPTSRAVSVLRIARLLLHLARGLLIAAIVFPFIGDARRRTHIRRWSRQLLAILAIRLHVVPPAAARARTPERAMLVANHVSWIDIFAIDAVMPARFVAKSEVARWPLVGWLSTRAGTLYVRRTRRHDTARINRDVRSALQRGDLVAVFPEGTTTDGSRLRKFHSSLLQPAVSEQAAIVPVALSYWKSDGTRCTELAYDSRWSLWDTVRRMVRVKRIRCTLTLLPALQPQRHRRELTDAAHRAIAEVLEREVSGTRTEKPGGLRGAAR